MLLVVDGLREFRPHVQAHFSMKFEDDNISGLCKSTSDCLLSNPSTSHVVEWITPNTVIHKRNKLH